MGYKDWQAKCKCDGDNMDEVCPDCPVSRECEEYLRPLAEKLHRLHEIGEV